MAKIPPYCDYTNEIRSLLLEGRRYEAISMAAGHLRRGVASPLLLTLVADLLEPRPKGRGRPTSLPYKWMEIGQDFEDLRDRGVTYEAATKQIAGKYFRDESTIEKTVRMYRAAVKAAHEND